LDKYGDSRIKLRRCVAENELKFVVAVRDKDMTVVTIF